MFCLYNNTTCRWRTQAQELLVSLQNESYHHAVGHALDFGVLHDADDMASTAATSSGKAH